MRTPTSFLTKADLRRAVIRTAAKAHAQHDRTGTRAIAAGSQDNDGWTSDASRAAMIAFARQQRGAAFSVCQARTVPASSLYSFHNGGNTYV